MGLASWPKKTRPRSARWEDRVRRRTELQQPRLEADRERRRREQEAEAKLRQEIAELLQRQRRDASG